MVNEYAFDTRKSPLETDALGEGYRKEMNNLMCDYLRRHTRDEPLLLDEVADVIRKKVYMLGTQEMMDNHNLESIAWAAMEHVPHEFGLVYVQGRYQIGFWKPETKKTTDII